MRVKVPRINRSKLVAMGREKILYACDVHAKQVRRFKPFDRRHRIAQGLLAQCFTAFKEVSHKPVE